MRLSIRHTLLIMINLGAVYLAVGSFAFLISSLSDRRSRAIGIVFATLLASFLLNFLAQFQDWAKTISPWLSVMEYYRPAIIIQSSEFPLSDVGVLLTLACVLWVAAALTFRRRNICTV